MSESHNPHDPELATDDAVLDALVGLESLGRCLDALVEAAPADHGAAIADDLPAEPLDALLGLISLRHTLRLVVAAMCGEAAELSMASAATWHRDLLR